MIKRLKVEPYGFHIVLCRTRKMAEKVMVEMFGDKKSGEYLKTVHGLTVFGPDHGLMMYATPRAATVAHEALHAANYMLKHAGVKISAENDEAQAYLVGWLVGEFLKKEGWR